MDMVSTLRQGFAVIPDVFDLAEVDRIADLLAGYESVGTRCLLDCPWCQETTGVLRERLNASIPELRLLCAVQCTFFNKTADAPAVEGSAVTYWMISGREVFPIKIRWFSRETYEQALRSAGFFDIRWVPLALDPAGIESHGETYWREYLDNPPIVGLDCRL